MANLIYSKYKEALLAGDSDSALNGSGLTGLYVALVDTGAYTFSDSHQFYTDLGAGVIGTDQEITSVTTTNGVVDGADVVFSALTATSVEALVLYRKNSGASSTWRLVAYIDTGVTGLPVTPIGGDIDITWNASGIFKL